MVGRTNMSPSDDQDPLIVSAIDNWYNEGADYTSYYGMASPPLPTPKEVLHFTQVVWKGTLTVGCASHFCPAGSPMGKLNSWFMVCNYGPEGKSSDLCEDEMWTERSGRQCYGCVCGECVASGRCLRVSREKVYIIRASLRRLNSISCRRQNVPFLIVFLLEIVVPEGCNSETAGSEASDWAMSPCNLPGCQKDSRVSK